MCPFITEKAFINGAWLETDSTFNVTNPFTGDVIGKVADCDEAMVLQAVKTASAAFSRWKQWTARQRCTVFKRWADLIVSEKHEIGKVITQEIGKPLAQSIEEVNNVSSIVEWCSEEGRRTYGLTIPSPHPSKRMITSKQPVGVVSLITPSNYPAAMVARKVCAALAAGCAVVLKPSEEAPFTSLALASLADKAGIPPGVFNVVPTSRSNAPGVVELLCTHPTVAAISFTGSTATGKIILRHAALTVKKVSLQLGGLAPLLVFDSCDLEKAVKGTIASKFRYSGQRCVSTNRILVQSGIHDRFVVALKDAIERELVCGDVMDPKTTLGPLINDAGLRKVQEQLNDALEKGAKLVTGGRIVGRNTMEATLITGVNTTMKCFNEETFGPLAPVCKFDTEEEALAIANDTTTGLSGYIFSEDVGQCWRVSELIETGMVGINEVSFSVPEAPFGGFKESGLGREGSSTALDEFMETKYACWAI